MFHHGRKLMILGVGLVLAAPAMADDFTARLGRVPVDSRTQSSVQGIGHATAELNGDTLAIDGDFEGMLGAATSANLHMGSAVGVRGPAIHVLTVTARPDGEVSGSIRLSAEEIAALRAGHIYIQIQSVSAPEGNLWGWLFIE